LKFVRLFVVREPDGKRISQSLLVLPEAIGKLEFTIAMANDIFVFGNSMSHRMEYVDEKEFDADAFLIYMNFRNGEITYDEFQSRIHKQIEKKYRERRSEYEKTILEKEKR
jgi:hypothetical protein